MGSSSRGELRGEVHLNATAGLGLGGVREAEDEVAVAVDDEVGGVQGVEIAVARPEAEDVAAQAAVVLPAVERVGLPGLGVDAVGGHQRVGLLVVRELGLGAQVQVLGGAPHGLEAARAGWIGEGADQLRPLSELVAQGGVGDGDAFCGALVPHAGDAVAAQGAAVEQQRAVGTAGEVELDEHGVVGDRPGAVVQLELEVDGLLDAVAVDAVDADDAWRVATTDRWGEVGEDGGERRVQLGALGDDAHGEVGGHALGEADRPARQLDSSADAVPISSGRAAPEPRRFR